MNVYRDDTIILSQDSSRRLISNLMNDDNNNLSLRDAFIADILDSMFALEDGSILIDVPADLGNAETNDIRISITDTISLSPNEQPVHMINYSPNGKCKKTKYRADAATPNYRWEARVSLLDKAAS